MLEENGSGGIIPMERQKRINPVIMDTHISIMDP